MCQVVGQKLEENIIKPLSQEELKLKRLAYYEKVKEIII
jgi:hypothetical protein